MKKILTYIFLSLSTFVTYSQQRTFEILNSGYLKCFDTLRYNEDAGKYYTCEPSTVLNFHDTLFIGNDKIFPDDYTSIFTLVNTKDTIDCATRQYNKNSLFYRVHKFESSTILPDSSFVIFSGAFDYPENHPKEGKYHNTAVFFNPENITQGGVLHTADYQDSLSSVDIKKALRQSLIDNDFPQGPPYLKVEALTVVPDNKILFGIREYGESYKNFNYTITVIETSYKVENKNIILSNDFRKIYTFRPDYPLELGLSAMEYNPADSCLYIVTSYEAGNTTFQIGAYLWYIKLNDLYAGKPLQPISISEKKHKPLTHKIEGLTFLSSNKILLLSDDDRVTGEAEKSPLFLRKLNEAYWYIIQIKK